MGAEETDSCKHFGNTDFSKILVIKRARFISPSFLSLKNENNISTHYSASSYASRNCFLSYVLASGGAPGWLRSWSRSSWVRDRHRARCCQRRARFGSCLQLSLPLPHSRSFKKSILDNGANHGWLDGIHLKIRQKHLTWCNHKELSGKSSQLRDILQNSQSFLTVKVKGAYRGVVADFSAVFGPLIGEGHHKGYHWSNCWHWNMDCGM